MAIHVDIEEATLGGQIAPLHPGTILKETIFPRLDTSLAQIRRALELSEVEFHQLLKGKFDIDESLANRISSLIGGEPETWLRLQAMYDVYLGRSSRPTGPSPR